MKMTFTHNDVTIVLPMVVSLENSFDPDRNERSEDIIHHYQGKYDIIIVNLVGGSKTIIQCKSQEERNELHKELKSQIAEFHYRTIERRS